MRCDFNEVGASPCENEADHVGISVPARERGGTGFRALTCEHHADVLAGDGLMADVRWFKAVDCASSKRAALALAIVEGLARDFAEDADINGGDLVEGLAARLEKDGFINKEEGT